MSDCSTSQNFSTGQTVTAAIMNAIVPSIIIQPGFIGGKPVVGTLANGDSLFGLSAGNALQQILFSSLQSQILSNSVGASQAGVANAIMNGDGLVSQRPASASIAATGYTALDKWKWGMVGSAGRATVAQGPNGALVAGSPYSLSCINITVPSATSTIAAGDFQYIAQIIENNLILPTLGGAFSFSFLYNTNFSGVISVFFLDVGNAHSYVVPVTLTGDSAWHQATIQNVTGLSSQTVSTTYGASSLTAGFALLSGTTFQTGTTGAWQAGSFLAANTQGNLLASTSNFLKIAQVMLNPGATSVPFYAEPYVTQLLKCQRYFWKTYQQGTAVGAVTNVGVMEAQANSTTSLVMDCIYPNTMRAAPTVTFYNATSGLSGTWGSVTAPAASNQSDRMMPSATCTGVVSGTWYNGHLIMDADY